MNDRLLEDVLGPEGAAVLARAAQEDPSFADALRPRAALAWARLALADGFDGVAPGRPDVKLMVKSESWTATMDEGPISGKGEARLTALLLTLVAAPVNSATPSPVLERLGKNLDALAGAVWRRHRGAVAALRSRARSRMSKAAPGGGGAKEPRGPAAAPTGPTPPQGPQAPQGGMHGQPKPPNQPKQPKPPGGRPPVTMKRSELEALCTVCGRSQLRSGGLVGCFCFVELVKNVQWTLSKDVFSIKFPANDHDGMLAFLEATRGHRG